MYGCNCANSFRRDNSNQHGCNCRETVFDTTLHMSHHYRRINSAKCVVNTSAPRSYNYRQICCSDKGSTSRLSTPSVLSNYGRVPSRTNSNCDVRRKANNSLQNVSKPGGRSCSVPPRPVTRKACNSRPSTSTQRKPTPQFSKKANKTGKKSENTDYKTNDSPKHTLVQAQSVKESEDTGHDYYIEEQCISSKKPIPTPRSLLQANVPLVTPIPDYEYLQFSLRITEDIIRNDLYSQREMKRVFNSHIEANRGRLSMTKMLQQIDNLCKELNISKKVSRQIVNHDKFPVKDCCCQNDKRHLPTSCNLSLNSKQTLIEKIVNGQYEITDEEIKDFNENELQQVISGLMNDEPVDLWTQCGETSDIVVHNLDLSRSTVEKYNAPQVSFRSSISSNVTMIDDNTKETVQNETNSENVRREISPADFEDNNLSRIIEDLDNRKGKERFKSTMYIDIIEESSTSNVIKENSSGTSSDNSVKSSLVSEDKKHEELKKNENLSNEEIKETDSLMIVPTKESNSDKELNKSDSLIERLPVVIVTNSSMLQEVIEDNIVTGGGSSSVRKDVTKHNSYDKRTHSLLEAETALKHVISNMPSWNSVPASYLTDENKDNEIITSTPVNYTPNTSDEKVEITASNDQIKISSESVDKMNKNQQSVTSGDKSHVSLITETAIIFNSNENKSQNNILQQTNLDSAISLNIKQKAEENTILRKNSISSEKTNVPLKEETSGSSVVSEISTVKQLQRQTSLCTTNTKQQNDVSINTEYSVADTSIQCELVNMKNSLKLGTDKCTQTSFHSQEPQYLMSAKYSNTTRNVCSTVELSKPSCTILYHQGIEHLDSTSEILRTNSTNVLENNDNDDVYTAESTSAFVAEKTVNQNNNVVTEIRSSDVNNTNILRNSDPTDDFISTIQQMLLANVNSLSEIINPPVHSSNKSIAKSSISNIDYNKYEKQETDKYALSQYASRNENSEIFLNSCPNMETCTCIPIPNIVDRNSELVIPIKEKDLVSMSEGEINITSKTRTEIPKVKTKKEVPNYKNYVINSERNLTVKRESKVLEKLKKYEHQVVPDIDHLEPQNITLSDYELKMFEQQQYLPRVQASFLFPSIGTQTSFTYMQRDSVHSFVRQSSSKKFSNEILLSDGELRSSSTHSDYETKTDISEDQNSSDGKGY